MINKKILLELMNDEAFKQETIGLLNSLMDKEMQKSDDEIDFDFIEECSDAIISLTDGDESRFMPVLLGSKKFLAEIRKKQLKKKIPAVLKTAAAAMLAIVVAYAFKNYYANGIIPVIDESSSSAVSSVHSVQTATSETAAEIVTASENNSEKTDKESKKTEKATTEKQTTSENKTTSEANQDKPTTKKETTTKRPTTTKKETTTKRPTTTKRETTTRKPTTTKPTTTKSETTVPHTTETTVTQPSTQPTTIPTTEPVTQPSTKPIETTSPTTSENTNVNEGEIVLSLRFAGSSPKSQYKIGEELELDSIKILVIYYDGSTSRISGADCEISGYDNQKAGMQTVTLKYKAKTLDFNVNVME